MGNPPVEVTGICTEYTKPSRLSVSLSAPGEFDGDQTYQLIEIADGKTRLQVTGHFRYAGWFARLTEPLITRVAKNSLAADLAKLKSLMER
jgi:polyketide cyclase/dehydrase/lipid transport protein